MFDVSSTLIARGARRPWGWAWGCTLVFSHKVRVWGEMESSFRDESKKGKEVNPIVLALIDHDASQS